MFSKSDAVLIAVAMGETRAAAEARIDAAYPDPVAPTGKAVTGLRREVRDGKTFETDLLADGTESAAREVAG